MERSQFSNSLPSAVRWTQILQAERLHPGDLAIDATAGNGHDTLFLAHQVGPTGHVFALDVQPSAIQSTLQRLTAAAVLPTQFTLAQIGHEHLRTTIPAPLHGHFQAVMFNLGYLPGSDKTIITRAATTLTAVHTALDLLAPGGLLTLALYPAHPGGAEETHALTSWARTLDPSLFDVQQLRTTNARTHPPECWAVLKRPRQSH